MVTPLPEDYRKSPDALISFDWVDATAGTGYITYYLGKTGLNGAEKYVLSNKVFYSDSVMTFAPKVIAVPSTFELIQDLDFDLSINKQLNVEGKMIVNVAVAIRESNDDTYSEYIHVKL
ncbi:hypothetical protein LCGC14_1975990, partial [marine sediment metagenome]